MVFPQRPAIAASKVFREMPCIDYRIELTGCRLERKRRISNASLVVYSRNRLQRDGPTMATKVACSQLVLDSLQSLSSASQRDVTDLIIGLYVTREAGEKVRSFLPSR